MRKASELLRIFFCAETMCLSPFSRKKSYSGVSRFMRSLERLSLQVRMIPGGIGLISKLSLLVISTVVPVGFR